MSLLDVDLADRLKALPAWTLAANRGGVLFRQYVFSDFVQAFDFMSQVAQHAERLGHHPEWFNVYNRVDVTLTTHDAGGVTVKDVELASLMDQVQKSGGAKN